MERGYNEKMLHKQILRAREHSRNDVLKREKPQMSEQNITFKITYYPAFQNVRAIMEELYILPTPNKEHKKLLTNVPVIRFRIGKVLKDYIVRVTLDILNEIGRREPYAKKIETQDILDTILLYRASKYKQKK